MGVDVSFRLPRKPIGPWRSWFCWCPVKTASGWVWMRWIARRELQETGVPLEFSCLYWEYGPETNVLTQPK